MRLSRVAPVVWTILGYIARMCNTFPVHAAEERMPRLQQNKHRTNKFYRIFPNVKFSLSGWMKIVPRDRGRDRSWDTYNLTKKFIWLTDGAHCLNKMLIPYAVWGPPCPKQNMSPKQYMTYFHFQWQCNPSTTLSVRGWFRPLTP